MVSGDKPRFTERERRSVVSLDGQGEDNTNEAGTDRGHLSEGWPDPGSRER